MDNYKLDFSFLVLTFEVQIRKQNLFTNEKITVMCLMPCNIYSILYRSKYSIIADLWFSKDITYKIKIAVLY